MAGLFVWNENGELGLNDEEKRDTPVELDLKLFNYEELIQVAAGYNYSVALTKCAKIYTWGKNCHGVLGQGKKNVRVEIPKVLRSLFCYKIIFISAGVSHILAVSEDGRVVLLV